MKKYILFASIAVFCLSLMFANVAKACPVADTRPEIIIKAPLNLASYGQDDTCLDQQCIYSFRKTENGGNIVSSGSAISDTEAIKAMVTNNQIVISLLNYNSRDNKEYLGPIIFGVTIQDWREGFLNTDSFYEAVSKLIQGDFSSTKQDFYKHVQRYMDHYTDAFAYNEPSQNELTIEAFNSTLFDMWDGVENFMPEKCTYLAYAKSGDWMFNYPMMRDYCTVHSGGVSTCPSIVISHPKFFAYLVTHPISSAWWYLLIYVLVLAVIVAIIVLVVMKIIRKIGKSKQAIPPMKNN